MTRQQRIARMETLLANVQAEKREFTAEERKEFDGLEAACKEPQGALRVVEAPAVHTKPKARYSLSRALRSAMGDRNVDDGYEREAHQELLRMRQGRGGREVEGLLVPMSAFGSVQRAADGVTVSPDTGHSLVGIDQRDDLFLAVDNFFLPPVAAKLGVTMTTTSENSLLIPRQKTRLNGGWIARDGTATASSDATFDALTLLPTTFGLQFTMKRSLVYATHPQAEAILMNDARMAIESGLDTAIISGTGTSNQPTGFLAAAGSTAAASISAAVNTGNAYDYGRKLRNELENYLKTVNPSIKWLLHPMFTALLHKAIPFASATTPLVPEGGTTWTERSFVESYALPTPAGGPPTTTKGLLGDFSASVGCVFGPSVELIVNPWADSVFASGAMLARALVDFNVCHRDPKRILRFDTETL